MSDTLARAFVLFCRIVQVALVLLAVLFPVGALLANMSVIGFGVILLFSIALFAAFAVVELVVRMVDVEMPEVWHAVPRQRRRGGDRGTRPRLK